MMIYMTDTAFQPSPPYCAGDCILIGSGTKGASEISGIPTISGRSWRNIALGYLFLIALHIETFELPWLVSSR